MLLGLAIRDVVLIEALHLSPGPGLTALTGETGAGKSILLDALGLAIGARSEAGLVRPGAAQASATAIFAPDRESPVWGVLEAKGVPATPGEEITLRRVVGADGRSRAFVNDEPVGVALLRELGTHLVEVHGQHETVGLLDSRTHLALLDRAGGCGGLAQACARAWSVWREAMGVAEASEAAVREAQDRAQALDETLAELDRLAPVEGEAARLADIRSLMGAAEKALADISSAREHLDSDRLTGRLGQAFRALERVEQRLAAAGAGSEDDGPRHCVAARQALDRALAEVAEAEAKIDATARSLDFEPDALDRAESRLFALRAAARRLNVEVDDLARVRAELAGQRLSLADVGDQAREDRRRAEAAREDWLGAAQALSKARHAAAAAFAAEIEEELAPLKLDKARFRVAVEALDPERGGPSGLDRVEFQIATVPGAPFGALGAIASGGELARLALALKVRLAARGAGAQPLMIFDEVDQGVGGAVADAVGLRLQRLARAGQVLVVTHSPQIAARAEAHWRVRRGGDEDSDRATTAVEPLTADAREEEIARMLSGANITEAARAAARALMHA